MNPNESQKIPLRRNFISLESKIQILDRLQKGEKVSHVANSLNLNEATVRTIKKNEEKIRTAVAAGSSISANMTARPRALIIEKMEKALIIWIDDSNKNQIPLDGNLIKQKALEIYNYLKESGETSVNPEFVASKGWFERFKIRFSLHNIRFKKENSSAGSEEVVKYPEKVQRTKKVESSRRIFDFVETNLGWRDVPNRTFILKKERSMFEDSKDRVDPVDAAKATENGVDATENGVDASVEIAQSVRRRGFDEAQELTIKEENANFMEEEESASNEIPLKNGNAEENSVIPNFTLRRVQEGLDLAERLESYFFNADPSSERRIKFKRELEKCLAPYRRIYEDLSTKREQTQYLGAPEECPVNENILKKRKRSCFLDIVKEEEK